MIMIIEAYYLLLLYYLLYWVYQIDFIGFIQTIVFYVDRAFFLGLSNVYCILNAYNLAYNNYNNVAFQS